MKTEFIKCMTCGDLFNPERLWDVVFHEHFDQCDGWMVGDKFTTPETGDKIFTVSGNKKTLVYAPDTRSRSGEGWFDKSYISKINPN